MKIGWKTVASSLVFAGSAVLSTVAEVIRYNAIKSEVKEQLPKEVARQLKKKLPLEIEEKSE